jgi:flavin reductase (DIM6/NTAB) family NADH-FMN oxidoreductase RutF
MPSALLEDRFMALSDLPHQMLDLELSLNRELWIVTARAGRAGGLLAGSVSLVSVVPSMPRVLIGIGRRSATWELIEASGSFALNLIAEDQLEWVERFGLQSGRTVDKLAGLAHETSALENPILTDAPGWLDCRVEGRFDIGDRTLYLGQVLAVKDPAGASLLTLRRLFELVDPALRQRLVDQRIHDCKPATEDIVRWRDERAGV